MLPACAPDPELLLRHLLAHYSRLPVDNPKVIDAAAQIQDVAERGFGNVTWNWRDGVLYGVDPHAPIMFDRDGLTARRKI